MNDHENEFNKNIMIAVDESENARRAVEYVGKLISGAKGFKILILHVIREPEEDYFPTVAERDKWLDNHKLKTDEVLKEYSEILIQAGIKPAEISVRSTLRHCPSLAECILMERQHAQCNTIVVGRQGLSRSEEFLFGSVSSKIVNHARNCTVWVVE